MTLGADSIAAFTAIPRDAEGPVFSEPWEAQAFGLAVQLSSSGYFTWTEWAQTISQEIKAAQKQGDPDLGTTYYTHWLNALEKLCLAKGLVGINALQERKVAWQQAYLNTPHGQPVELKAESGDNLLHENQEPSCH